MSKNHADFTGDKNPLRNSLEAPGAREKYKTMHRELWSKKDAAYRKWRGEHIRTGCGDLTGTLWASIKANARTRRIEFRLSVEDAWSLFQEQGGLCALSGVSLTCYAPRGERPSASLDRIDSSKGYSLDNVQWVHKHVNLMKRSLSNEEFVAFCRKVTRWNKKSKI